jgi:uncharacterized membrane protein/nitrite reductase/ring-hydroxylating ferredoxin subunit
MKGLSAWTALSVFIVLIFRSAGIFFSASCSVKSKVNIKGHPLHPILVSFPIALLTGAFLLDLLTIFTGNLSYSDAAVYSLIGGLVSAVIAAIPGAVDYFHTVPPDSSAKKRASSHALLNISALFVFIFALLFKKKGDVDLIIIAAIEFGGVVLLGIAGWHGGTLIIRNQIGVDHRYAGAGKWSEETITTTEKNIPLKDTDKLKLNQMRLLRVNSKRIVIARTESGIVAFEDRCSHRGGSLADGALICGTVQCPWHGSQFDTTTGAVKAGPGSERIRIYPVSEKDGTFVLHL